MDGHGELFSKDYFNTKAGQALDDLVSEWVKVKGGGEICRISIRPLEQNAIK